MTQGPDGNHGSADHPLTGVVVGFDGSATSVLALDWAVDAAAAYGGPLTLLRARPDAEGEILEVEALGVEALELLGEGAAEALQAEADRASARHPEVRVRVVIHPKSPVDALLDASQTADVLVIGSRGLEGFRGLALGSTTMNVTPHAHCPVVVLYQPDEQTSAAKDSARHPSEVVVGYDGSGSADLALAFALRHAMATGLGVAVLIVSKGAAEADAAVPMAPDAEGLSDAVRELARLAAEVADTHASVPVRYFHRVGRPAGLLIEEAAGAPLAVVGARGRGGFAGLVLGSVGLQMLIHAECPVAVVHSTARQD